MQKTTHVFPILGVKSVEQFEANLDALNVALTDEHLEQIDSTIPWDTGFPHNMLVSATETHHTQQCNFITGRWNRDQFQSSIDYLVST